MLFVHLYLPIDDERERERINPFGCIDLFDEREKNAECVCGWSECQSIDDDDEFI